MKNIQKKSHIVVGTMKWGTWGANLNTSEATKFLIKCFEAGLNHFDLANIYGNYQTEKLFGEALKASGINRNEIFITSKFGIEYPCSQTEFLIKTYNSSEKHFNFSLERSLNEIQTNYLDEYLLHRPDFLLDGENLALTVNKAKNISKIYSFGVSNFTLRQFDFLNNYIDLSTNQIQFSLTHLDSLLNDEFLYFQDKKTPLMIWSPLGMFFKENNDQTIRIKNILDKLSKKYNLNYNQLLILFITKLPNIISPILGSTKIERLLEIKDAFNISLDYTDWYEMLEASKGIRVV